MKRNLPWNRRLGAGGEFSDDRSVGFHIVGAAGELCKSGEVQEPLAITLLLPRFWYETDEVSWEAVWRHMHGIRILGDHRQLEAVSGDSN